MKISKSLITTKNRNAYHYSLLHINTIVFSGKVFVEAILKSIQQDEDLKNKRSAWKENGLEIKPTLRCYQGVRFN